MCTPTNILGKMLTSTSEDYFLQQLYKTDPVLFDEQFVRTIVTLGSCNSYTIKQLSDVPNLLLSNTFNQYAISAAPSDRQAFMKLFDVYFRAIGRYVGKQSGTIRMRILALLGINFSIPTTSLLSFQEAKVSITTNYKPRDVDMISTKMDIESVMKDQLCDSINNTIPTDMLYTLTPGTVQLQGALLPDLITNILILQEEMAKATTSLGVQVKPFLNVQRIDTRYDPITSMASFSNN